jgi:hypothetical protein
MLIHQLNQQRRLMKEQRLVMMLIPMNLLKNWRVMFTWEMMRRNLYLMKILDLLRRKFKIIKGKEIGKNW